MPDVDEHIANFLDLPLRTDPDRYIVDVSSQLVASDHCLVKSVLIYPTGHEFTAKGHYGGTRQQIGMRCDISLRLVLGGRLASLQEIRQHAPTV